MSVDPPRVGSAVGGPVIGGPGSHIAVDPKGLGSVAREVGQVLDDLQAAVKVWDNATNLQPQDLSKNNPPVVGSWRLFKDGWSKEFGQVQWAVRDKANNLHHAAKGYHATDESAAYKFEM